MGGAVDGASKIRHGILGHSHGIHGSRRYIVGLLPTRQAAGAVFLSKQRPDERSFRARVPEVCSRGRARVYDLAAASSAAAESPSKTDLPLETSCRQAGPYRTAHPYLRGGVS